MKIILAGIAGLMAAALNLQTVRAQFTGKLVYEVDQPENKLFMTYVQSDTSALSSAYSYRLKKGVIDSTTYHAQDTIIWNFAAATETHLQYKTGIAYKQPYIANKEAAFMAARMKGKGAVEVSSKGADTANGYNCTHYVITTTSPLGTSTRDVWVTGDLGAAPTVYVISSYLYFPPGYPTFTKLTAAGANGVVVRSVSSFTREGITATMNLIAVDSKRPRPLVFKVPARYTLVDETGFSFPTGK